MNPSIIIGQLLLWSGFVSGSLAAVYSTENAADPWATVNWTWYIISALVCIGGIVFLRIGKSVAKDDTETSEANFNSLPNHLHDVLGSIRKLQSEQQNLPPSKIVEFIDEHCADGLREFADARESIITNGGLSSYAEVMTQFAAGERAINRAWSASADGYLDETETCLSRAETFLQNALNLLESMPGGSTSRIDSHPGSPPTRIDSSENPYQPPNE